MNLGDLTDLITAELIRVDSYTSRLYVWLRNYRFLTCLYARISSTFDFRKYRQSWSKQEIHRRRVMKITWVIKRILLLLFQSPGSWLTESIQWVMIQVTEMYETNGDFLVFRSVGSPVSIDPIIQTIRTLMSSYKPPSHEL